MKIAIINENSQAPKNGIIEAALKKVVEPMGHEVVNYGMYSDASPRLTYVQCGILAAILLNSGAADFAMPFAKGFGWGGELNLEYTFEKLFGFGFGKGYPADRVEAEQSNKKILDGVRAVAFKPLIEILKGIDQDLLKGAIAGEHFQEQFFADCKDPELAAYVKTLL